MSDSPLFNSRRSDPRWIAAASLAWLTCECCGSVDDDTTTGFECEDEYINLCAECAEALTFYA